MNNKQRAENDLAIAIRARCIDPNGTTGIISAIQQVRAEGWRDGVYTLENLICSYIGILKQHPYTITNQMQINILQTILNDAKMLVIPN